MRQESETDHAGCDRLMRDFIDQDEGAGRAAGIVGIGGQRLLHVDGDACDTVQFHLVGGIFQKAMEPGFFASLNDFWAGAGWLNSATTLIYFPAQRFGGDVAVLGIWAALAVIAVALTHLVVQRQTRKAASVASVPELAAAR